MAEDRRNFDRRSELETRLQAVHDDVSKIKTALLGIEGSPKTSFINRTDTTLEDHEGRIGAVENFRNKLTAFSAAAVMITNFVTYKLFRRI